MKSTDERMNEVLKRARAREDALRRKRQRAVAFGGGILGVVIVAAVGVGASSLAEAGMASQAATLGLMGSVFARGSALGYVVVGLLGLVLGAGVTAIAYRARVGRHGASDSAWGGTGVQAPAESAPAPPEPQDKIAFLQSLDADRRVRPTYDSAREENAPSSDGGCKP